MPRLCAGLRHYCGRTIRIVVSKRRSRNARRRMKGVDREAHTLCRKCWMGQYASDQAALLPPRKKGLMAVSCSP